ncbi:MAG TPA: acyl-CoA dehydrogenase family protein [Acidimicrobiales bacterium]|nr:acyl-CoA dehydrogenase family protein [Acidimicrobiales bacterium]
MTVTDPPAGAQAELDAAAAAQALASSTLRRAIARLARLSDGGKRLDEHQVLAYDLAHAAAGTHTAEAALRYGAHGPTEGRLAAVFVADVVADLVGRTAGREAEWDTEPGWHKEISAFLEAARDPAMIGSLAETPGPRHLDPDFELVRDSFRRFAEDQIAPRAEHIHRANADIDEEIIEGLAAMGGFGLSVPEEYGGFATGGENDYLGMVVATEELARASLGAGGSLVTRPEILTRAIVNGGTEEQKQRLLPGIASGELMVAVAVTEPDFGSDVANLSVTATPAEGGGWLVNGVKTWCTFAARADVLMLLARTDRDRSKAHRGLSLFVVEKPHADPHGFTLYQSSDSESPDSQSPESQSPDSRSPDPGVRPAGLSPGRLEGRPIDTIGYRGMHSYELAFENWWVPGRNLIGESEGEGRGFYLQMAGFENGRLQTAARAIGVMQAAYEAALGYARERGVFGRPIVEYQLTRVKLGRMAAIIQASRQFAYEVAGMMARGEGSMEASMVKAYVCRAAEWVSREAMQIHGGMGYAEEFPVSRLFVDARVLSIFEGADETLCLKVIARRLVEQA